jgi:hypothetical protein
LNAVYPHCVSTGGSTLIERKELEQQLADGKIARAPGPSMPTEYWADMRPVETVTLESLMAQHGLDLSRAAEFLGSRYCLWSCWNASFSWLFAGHL